MKESDKTNESASPDIAPDSRGLLKVNAIKNGTVIDHIPSQQLFRVIEILGLDGGKDQITFGMNLESRRLQSKAIIKVTNRFFEDDDVNRITLVAPHAKLNIIRNYEVAEKRPLALPEEIRGIAKCVNPKCVTNNEAIETRFKVSKTEKGFMLTCHFCEKTTDNQNLKIVRKT